MREVVFLRAVFEGLVSQVLEELFDAVGVEIGQLLVLGAILIVMGFWRKSPNFFRQAYTVNVVMMSMGFILMGYQITGYFVAA